MGILYADYDEEHTVLSRNVKRCPFCGNDILYATSEASYTYCYYKDPEFLSACISIECKKCHTMMHDHVNSDIFDYYTKLHRLIDKWNTRIPQVTLDSGDDLK